MDTNISELVSTGPDDLINTSAINNNNTTNLKQTKRRSVASPSKAAKKNKGRNRDNITRSCSLQSLSSCESSSSQPSRLTMPPPQSYCTANPFAPLAVPDEVDPISTPVRESKPPPIYIKNVTHYTTLCDALSRLVGKEKFTCRARVTDLIIQTETVESYRSVIRYLRDHNADYHTYQLQDERSYRIVIRHLHQTTSVDEIKQELTSLGHQVRNVAPVVHPVTKQTLPLFFVDLEPNSTNKDVFNIQRLCYCRVTVEEPHKRRLIVQCKRCQEYGHTKSYCQHLPKCVKCAGSHFTTECTKTRSTPATCALCKGDHPANYKGCIVHRELQRSRRTSPVFNYNSAQRDANVSSSQPATISQQPTQYPPLPSRHLLANCNQNLSYARVAAASAPPQASPQISSLPSADLSSVLNSFLSDFKALLTPVLSLLTTVVNSLLSKLAP